MWIGGKFGKYARVIIDARFEIEWWCEPGTSHLDAIEVLMPRIEIKWWGRPGTSRLD